MSEVFFCKKINYKRLLGEKYRDEYFIRLTKGQRTKVDKGDYEYLSQFYWHASPTRTKNGYYATRNNGYNDKGTRLKIKMHREIMNCPPNMEVDHINGDTLDNRRCNLRVCSHSKNIQNQKSRGGASPYRGITFHKGRWRARITVNYKRISLGLYDNQEEANRAILKAHAKYYGILPKPDKP